jgi:hypothetical protein
MNTLYRNSPIFFLDQWSCFSSWHISGWLIFTSNLLNRKYCISHWFAVGSSLRYISSFNRFVSNRWSIFRFNLPASYQVSPLNNNLVFLEGYRVSYRLKFSQYWRIVCSERWVLVARASLLTGPFRKAVTSNCLTSLSGLLGIVVVDNGW